MSDPSAPRALPARPNLRHLKDQAKALVRKGQAVSLSEAQFQIARMYGFASWPRLKTHVELQGLTGALKQAIDRNDLEAVKALMSAHPALHGAVMGYNSNGPLTWVAECRVPWEPPGSARLAMAQWMIDHGSDVHQGGDGPLMRAALQSSRIPMMELLVRNGADVNAEWNGYYPIVFAPCETVEPEALQWLLEHGANPECPREGRKYPHNALDFVIGTYSRSKELRRCIDVLLDAGCTSSRAPEPVLELLRGRAVRLGELLDEDSDLVRRQFAELDLGSTAYRRLTLRGAMLLHVAAEYGDVEMVRLLLERGADVNARAAVDAEGVGGQTPLFHAVAQFGDWGLSVSELLVNAGADLGVRACLPGHYERPAETVVCTPLEYARLFPGGENRTVAFLQERGGSV